MQKKVTRQEGAKVVVVVVECVRRQICEYSERNYVDYERQ